MSACALPLTVGGLWAVPVAAQQAETPPTQVEQKRSQTLRSILIEGNQRIEIPTILSYINIRQGEPVDRYAIDQSLKSLFATGFFSDIRIQPVPLGDGLVDVQITVTENPIISRVAFEGNKRVKDEELEKEVDLRSRSVFTRDKVKADTQRIIQIYQRSGRYSVKIEPKIIPLENNRVNLVYEIDEGPETAVQGIDFIGNSIFSDEALAQVIRTQEYSWWNPFSSNEKYDPDRMLYDKELLRRFYVSQGYADFQVKSAIAELSPNNDGFYLSFTVDEGEKYNYGEIDIKSTLAGSRRLDFTEDVTTLSGEVYNADEVENSIENIVETLGEYGYAFVDVKPDFTRNTDKRTIDLTYRVKEGPKVFIERINVTGNSRTLDEVIRREFRLAEGDPYSSSKLARSEQRINNLGYFGKVDIAQAPGSSEDQTVVNVNVEEQSTGEVTFGAGYSTVDGPLADFGIRESNLLGKGQELRLRALAAARRQQYDIGFTEPWFLGRELSAGIDLFKTRSNPTQQTIFDRESLGGALRLGYTLGERLTHNMYYRIEDLTIDNIDANASRFIRDQEGSYLSSMAGHSLTWDNRNNRFEPTEGWYLKLDQDLAGLGGDARFIRHEARSAWYYPLAPQWTFMLGGTAGHAVGLGRDIRINQRFFIGGRDIRGFELGGLGPRDITTNDSLGGNVYYTGSGELTFPLPGMSDELGFLGAAFIDVGSLWDPDVSGPEVVDNRAPRVSAGVGLSWKSPFGPIRLDFAYPIMKEDEDIDQIFNFNFGTRF